jgi:hypothetical protein
MTKIYLAGPINSCSEAECKDWRERAKKEIPELVGDWVEFIDPMRRDYRGKEMEPGITHMIVKGDKTDYRKADIMLVYSPKPSYGTAMEMFDAFENLKKWVVVVNADAHPSPWLVEHCDYRVPTFEAAFEVIKTIITEMQTK